MKRLLFLFFCLALVGGARRDGCLQKFGKTGVCKAYFQRWGYNAGTGKCEEFTYGGCGGNGNNFESKKECERRCMKRLPKK